MSVLRSPWRFLLSFLLILNISLFSHAQEQEGDKAPATELNIEDMRRRIAGEAPLELVGLKLWDTDVNLFMTGFWKGTLQGNLGFATNPLGNRLISPETPVLFTQEADLTLSLWIRERWFVEANFLDNSSINTYRAGYQGFPGEYVQYAGIGNTGLDFPVFPYLDLGGDSPSSFGFYSRLGGGDLSVHTLFRYDSAAREERVFVGSRERTYSYVQPQSPVRGISFVLPDTAIDSEPVVYIEDERGSLWDNEGRRWRIAAPSEYAAGRNLGLVELSHRPTGMVAVSYSKSGDSRPWENSMGDYSGVPGDFLFEVQQWFDPLLTDINLKDLPQCWSRVNKTPEFLINNTPALVIREPGTFSPFERQNRYEAPSSASENATLVRLSTGGEFQGFELVPLDTGVLSAEVPLYAATERQRGFYELLIEGVGTDQRNPATRWPLVRHFPEIYLPGAGSFKGDLSLRFTNYGGTGAYSIGTDVVPGSVLVWRSGIQDPSFSYDLSSGSVSLSNPAGLNEIIRITYLKRTDETRLGSLAAGIGAMYRRGQSPFSAALALGIRWNLEADTSFTEEGVGSPGTVGLSAKTAWDYDFLKTQITAGLAFEQPDTTGLYRVVGMEGNEITLSLPPETSFISHPPESAASPQDFLGLTNSNRADLVFRNYRDNTVFGSTLMSIDWGGASVISGQNRPYPAKDPQLGSGTQVLVAEFTLDSARNWTGFEVPLGNNAEFLSRAGDIEIPYRFFGFENSPAADLMLVVQIGSLSSKDVAVEENPNLILERVIFDGIIDTSPRIFRISLQDEDRLRLGDARFLRLIAINSGLTEATGRVLLAPPIVRSAGFRAVILNGDNVKDATDFTDIGITRVRAVEKWDSGSGSLESAYGDIIKRLHPVGGQRILEVEWQNLDPDTSAGVDSRIGVLPLADYRYLSFFVKGPAPADNSDPPFSGETLTFIIAPGPDSLSDFRLMAEIPLSAFTPGNWSKVTIRYRGDDQGISVDNGNSSGAIFRYRPAPRLVAEEVRHGKNNYIAFFINPTGREITTSGSSSLVDGSFCIDEVILEEATPVYRLNLGTTAEYRRQGTLLSIGDTPVFADLLLSTAVESETWGDPFIADNEASGSMMNRSRAELSFFGAKLNGNVAFTAAKDTFLWSAGHGVSRSFGPLSVGESFFAAPRENSANHKFNIGLSSAFYTRFDAEANYDFSRLQRRWNLGLGYRAPKVFIPSLSINSQALWTSRDGKIYDDEGYGVIWARSWEQMIPDTGTDADGRRTSTQIVVTEGTRPVGAIITLDGTTNFTRVNNQTRSESSARLDVPVVLKNFSFNVLMGRNFRRQLRYSGNDALDDGNKFFESVSDSLPLWAVAPGYSLFAPELNDAMDAGLENSPSAGLAEYTAFIDRFGADVRLPSVYDLRSFVLPSRAGFRMERVLEQKMDTRLDVLNLGGSLGFSAINMFGVMGYRPLFRFYQSDEFTHGLEAVVAVPGNEENSWRIQSALGAGFRGFSGGILGFTNTLTLRSGGGWLESLRADWTVPTKRSLLSIFYGWIARAALTQSSWLGLSTLLNSDYEQLRRESLEMSFDYSGEYLRSTLSIGHESIVRILGRLNFSVFAKLDCSEDKQTENISVAATLGTTLRVSF